MNGGGSVGSVSSADPASPRSSLLWNNIYVPPEVVDICFRGRQRPLRATVLLRHFTKFLSQLRRKCISNSYFLHISCLPLTTQIFILSWIFLSSVHVHRAPCCRQSHMTVGAWGESCPHVQSSCVQCASACTTKPTSDLQCLPECLVMMLSSEITTLIVCHCMSVSIYSKVQLIFPVVSSRWHCPPSTVCSHGTLPTLHPLQ